MAATKDFFISRAGPDKEVAAWIAQELQKAGFSFVIQDRDFRIGALFPRSMEKAFVNCRTMIALLSPAYLESDHCLNEWHVAYALDVEAPGRLLPVRIAAGALPPLAHAMNYINLVDMDAVAAKAAKLHTGVIAFRQGGKLPDVIEPDTRPKTNSTFATCHFSGREDEMSAIHATLWAEGDKHPKVVVLHGLPGVGKSTVAREYARRHMHRYCGAWLVRSETETTLLADLADLAPALNAGLRVRDVQAAAHAAINEAQTLARQTGKPFLFVFDNIEGPKDLPDWTVGEGLHRVVSSRYGNWAKAVKAIEIESLPQDAARALLLESSDRKPGRGLDELLKCLDGLPLAIAQAGAYLRENPSETFATYAAQHQKRMGESPDDWPKDQQLVAATFKPSIEQAATKAPEAPALLRRASFFAPENIPLVLLSEHPEGEETRKAADALLRYSLWRRGEDGTTFDPTRSVHRLLQSIMHGGISENERHAEAMACADRLAAIFDLSPEDPRNWPTVKPLSSHAAALSEKTPDAAARPNLARVLNAAGVYFIERADYASAEPVLRRALDIDRRHNGDDHPSVASDLVSLGRFLTMTDRFEEAEEMLRRALAIDEKHLGVDHPSVARDLFHLGRLHHEADRFEDADKAFRRALEIDEKAHGPEHPEVCRDLIYLGKLLQDHDRFQDAEIVLRRAIEIDERQNDPDHPYIARDLMCYAELLQKVGRMHDAEPLMRRALAIDEGRHGDSHPFVARDLVSLGRLLWDDDRYDEAEPPLRRALDIDERIQGPEHTDVARDLICLARVLRSQDKLAEAEPMMRRALAIDEKRLGERHTDVARDLIALAKLLAHSDRFAEAEPLMKRALAIDESRQGRGHTDVARDLASLADLLLKTGRAREAEPLARRALAIDEARYGAAADDVARDLHLLGRVLMAMRRFADAEQALRRAVSIDQRLHTHAHADLSRDLDALAEILVETGALEEAEQSAKRAVEIGEKVQGADHTDVARNLLTLAQALQRRGRRKDAEASAVRAVDILAAKNHPDVQAARAQLDAIRRGARITRLGVAHRPRRQAPPATQASGLATAFNFIFGVRPPPGRPLH